MLENLETNRESRVEKTNTTVVGLLLNIVILPSSRARIRTVPGRVPSMPGGHAFTTPQTTKTIVILKSILVVMVAKDMFY